MGKILVRLYLSRAYSAPKYYRWASRRSVAEISCFHCPCCQQHRMAASHPGSIRKGSSVSRGCLDTFSSIGNLVRGPRHRFGRQLGYPPNYRNLLTGWVWSSGSRCLFVWRPTSNTLPLWRTFRSFGRIRCFALPCLSAACCNLLVHLFSSEASCFRSRDQRSSLPWRPETQHWAKSSQQGHLQLL